MSKQALPATDPSYALAIKLTAITDNFAVVNVRLRGEKSWMYFKDLILPLDSRVTFQDGQPETATPLGCRYSTRQREATNE